MILGDIIWRNAQLNGDREAIIFEGRRTTHRDFCKRVHRAANALLMRGVRHQERVAVLARNCQEALEIFGAGEMTGFITININSRLSVKEVEDICQDAQPTVFIYEAEFAAAAEALQARLPCVGLFVLIDKDPSGTPAWAESYESLLEGAPDTTPPLRADPEDVAYLIYTSGTTGKPKGVMFQQKAMVEAARTLALEGAAREPIKALIVMPLFHIGARIESLSFLLLGGCIVMHRVFDAERLLATIAAERITAMHVAPIMVQRILEVDNRDEFDTSSLECVRYASAPMPVPLLTRAIKAFGPIFIQVYGMTECLGGTTLKPHEHRIDGSPREQRRLASAGQPYLGTDLRIVRMDDSPADPGEIGEVLIRSPATMKGYWNNTAATVETLRDGWMHTQDLGYVDEDGFLFIVDRKKDMILSGGENIYSWEVEEALRRHPSVAEVAVIAVPDEEWGEAVKACVVLHAGASADESGLITFCREQIASYKKPRSIDFVPELPRLFNGKVDKKALRAPHWTGRDRQVS